MKAVAIDRFRGAEELKLKTLPTPKISPLPKNLSLKEAPDEHYLGKLALTIRNTEQEM